MQDILAESTLTTQKREIAVYAEVDVDLTFYRVLDVVAPNNKKTRPTPQARFTHSHKL